MAFTTANPGPLQLGRFHHQTPAISTSQCWIQFGIWVRIISWHAQYAECAVLAAHAQTAFRCAIRQIIVESLSKTREYRLIIACLSQPLNEYQSDRNLNVGRETACISAHSVCSSCHDIIRTQKLNSRQSGRNRKVGTAVRFQHSQKPTVQSVVQSTTPPGQSGLGHRTGQDLPKPILTVQTWTTGGLPGSVANTRHVHTQ